METLLLRDILSFCKGEAHHLEQLDTSVTSISTDSREIQAGSVFVAIEGEIFDGHHFVKKAMESGACCAVVSKIEQEYANLPLILVKDTMQAHIDIGEGYRDQFSPIVVGITGSVGKTTTKDMVSAVLSQKWKTVKTQGNFNNEIGLPKTLFTIDSNTEAAVIEMGMTNFGEIEVLSKAVKPQVGVITNIGVSHLENLKTRDNILKAKLEIRAGLTEGAPLLLNMDNDLLCTCDEQTYPNLVFYAVDHDKADFYAQDITEKGSSTEFVICHQQERITAIIPCIGKHNVQNAVCAYAVGRLLGMTQEQCIKGLSEYVPSGMRQKIYRVNDVTIMADCYNASPDSMKASIPTFMSIPCSGRHVAVLGDMLELGSMEEEGHLQIGELCANLHVDELICFGARSALYAKGAGEVIPTVHFTDREAVCRYLKDTIEPGDAVLFKASHSMRLEDIIEQTYGECENK